MKRVKRYEKMKSRSLFSAMEEQLFCYLKLQTLKRPSNAGGENVHVSLRHRPSEPTGHVGSCVISVPTPSDSVFISPV